MKRIISIFICFIVFLIILCVNTLAAESNIDQYNEEFDFDSFIDTLDDDTVSILSQMGISSLSFEDIFSVTPKKVFEALFTVVEKSVKEPLKYLFTSMGIIMLTNLVSTFTDSSASVKLLCSASLVLSLAVPIAKATTTAFSVLQSLSAFTTAFSGVFCAVISSSGQINVGVSYGALSVFSNSFFGGILSEVCAPVVNAMCSMGFLSCFDVMGFTERICKSIKKVYVFSLSLVGTVFSGIVTLKGVLSEGADNLATKSIRFVVGRSLPVVGGAVSESYSSLLTGLRLIKNTVGIFGIITVIVVVLPSVLQLCSWILCLEISSSFARGMDASDSDNMLGVIKEALILLVATIIILTAIFIVSVGVVIAVKGGGV